MEAPRRTPTYPTAPSTGVRWRPRARLGEEAFEAASTEGRSLSIEQAIACALDRATTLEIDSPKTYPAGLSAREIEILRLVADGLTNIEVAERLFLSSRTVDWHLSSVYRKLGLHSCPEDRSWAPTWTPRS